MNIEEFSEELADLIVKKNTFEWKNKIMKDAIQSILDANLDNYSSKYAMAMIKGTLRHAMYEVEKYKY